MRSAVLCICLAACGRVGFDGNDGSVGVADARDSSADDDSADAALPDGLVAWLPFDDDPTDGVDTFGSGHTTARCRTTCPQQTTGPRGGAYELDGVDEAILVADVPALHVDVGTLALWVRLSQFPSPADTATLIAKDVGTSSDDSWELYFFGDAMQLYAGGDADHTKQSYVNPSWSAPLGTWVHVAFTWDTTNIWLYFNGAMVAQDTVFGRVYDTHDVTISLDAVPSPTHYIHGAIDDVRIYDVTLSAAEIAALAVPQ